MYYESFLPFASVRYLFDVFRASSVISCSLRILHWGTTDRMTTRTLQIPNKTVPILRLKKQQQFFNLKSFIFFLYPKNVFCVCCDWTSSSWRNNAISELRKSVRPSSAAVRSCANVRMKEKKAFGIRFCLKDFQILLSFIIM